MNLNDLPSSGAVHFIGIGGSGMSGLAALLNANGYQVTGSDMSNSSNVAILREAGITIHLGHDENNIHPQMDLVVATLGAVGQDNPEVMKARALDIPVLDRGELLGLLTRQYARPIAFSGTQGKTTTTSLASRMWESAGTDPTVSVGTIAGDNYRKGQKAFILVEACEYRRAFHHLEPHTGVVLNIRAGDHGDCFDTFTDVKQAFQGFADRVQEVLVTSADHQSTRELRTPPGRRRVTFGINPDADYRAVDLTWDEAGYPSFMILRQGQRLGKLSPKLLGIHNVTNLLAAFAAASENGLSLDETRGALETFTGAPRRLEYIGKRRGVTVIDDLACTPDEMRATLSALRRQTDSENITVLLRPNSYSRVRDLLDRYPEAFEGGERIVLTGIFAGRDKDTYGMSARDVQKVLNEAGHQVHYIPDLDGKPDTEAISTHLDRTVRSGTLVIIGPSDLSGFGRTWVNRD